MEFLVNYRKKNNKNAILLFNIFLSIAQKHLFYINSLRILK